MSTRRLMNILKATGLIIAGLIPLLSSAPVLAASATMSLSAVGSVSKGSAVTVYIRENSGDEPVNAASATISYPGDKLRYLSTNDSSAFGVSAANSADGSSVHLERGALSAVTGSQIVASITFRALVDSGTAALGITSGSVLSANSNSDILAGTSGTNVALIPVPAAAEAPPPDNVPPTITKISVGSITPYSVIIAWTTSEPATSEVDYGLSQSYGLGAVDANLVTDHKVTLNSALITPATLYHFMVKNADAAGNPVSGPDGTFTTKGAVLLITVINQKNKPVSGAKVELANKSGVTNSKGQVTISGLPAGKLVGTVTHNGKQTVIKQEIAKVDPTGKTQNVTFKINDTGNLWPLLLIPIVLIVVLISFFAGWEERGGGSGTGFAAAQRDLSKRFRSFLDRKGSIAPVAAQPPKPQPSTPIEVRSGPQIVRPSKPPKTP